MSPGQNSTSRRLAGLSARHRQVERRAGWPGRGRRFPVSLLMVEEMLAAGGISATHETIRQWGLKFGCEFANRVRRRARRRGDKWHLDEVDWRARSLPRFGPDVKQ